MATRAALLVSAALFSSPAFAADLAPQPVEPVQPVYLPFSWTGFYVGAHAGWGFANVDTTLAAPLDSYDINGFVGGVHAGYNYQINQFVLGLEGDIDLTSISGRSDISGGLSTKTSIPWQGSVRGRLGYAWDRFLLYGTGGVAFADAKVESASTKTLAGWTLGAGVEYAFTDAWSARLEYRYTDFQKSTFVTPALGSFRNHLTENQVLVGISYKF